MGTGTKLEIDRARKCKFVPVYLFLALFEAAQNTAAQLRGTFTQRKER